MLTLPNGTSRALLLLGALATTPALASGQRAPPRTITYVYLRGVDTLGTEVLTIADSALSGVLTLRDAPRIDWSHAREGTLFGALSLRAYASGSVAGTAPLQDAHIRIEGDSAYADISGGASKVTKALPTKRGAVVLVNSSLVQAALIGARAARMNQPSVDLFLSSGAQTIPATVTARGDTIVFTVATAELRILIDANALPRDISVPSQNVRVVRATGPVSQPAPAAPINYDAPTGAPYTAMQVRIPTGRGYELAGTLTRPTLRRAMPVVVTISGSGPQERDSRLSIVPGYALFREVADTLARRGIATLRYDDRGIGESGGLESARTATSADFADDVRSIVEWLRTRPDIDASRIALAGHSEGGMIAPMVAASDPRVRAIALLAGPAWTGRRVMMFQNREALDAAKGLTPSTRDSIWKSVPARLDTLALTNKWIGFFMAHDPLVTASHVNQPVLILQGETDHQVSPEQADSLAAIMRASGNRRVTIRKFPATNHLFLNDPSGLFTGYATLKDSHVRREVLGALADWLVLTLR